MEECGHGHAMYARRSESRRGGSGFSKAGGDLESGDRRGISTRQFLLSKESPGRVVCLLLHTSMRFLPYKGYLDLFDWDPCALLG